MAEPEKGPLALADASWSFGLQVQAGPQQPVSHTRCLPYASPSPAHSQALVPPRMQPSQQRLLTWLSVAEAADEGAAS